MSDSSFVKCLAFLTSSVIEGSYSSDPKDPGNWTSGIAGVGEMKGTKYGISAASYPDLDIKNLTLDKVGPLYRNDFWVPASCGALSAGVDAMMFDAAVNQGVKAAKIMLQRACHVFVDEEIGPKTLLAAQSSSTLRDLSVERQLRYARSKNFDVYGDGWLTRVMRVYEFARGLQV